MKEKDLNINKERLIEQLKVDEGIKTEIYLDHLGYATFGIGHLIIEDDPEFGCKVGTAVSEERIEEVFEKDLQVVLDECKILYDSHWDSYPGEVKEILANMMFNLGRPRLSKFKNMTNALNTADWKKAAIEMKDSRWYHQVGDRSKRLVNRMTAVS